MKDDAVRVLLVDDEVELVSNLRKRMLRRGFTVVGTFSGKEAISAAESRQFDVAVVDLKMPGMDGLEVLERLKALQPTLRAIILTGHGTMEAAHRSGLLDAVSFLTKPAEFDELVELIQKSCDEKRELQRKAYDRELQKIISSYRSPHEIMEATDRLREKYDM
jgi:DNA-binding NtrC family response regulator